MGLGREGVVCIGAHEEGPCQVGRYAVQVNFLSRERDHDAVSHKSLLHFGTEAMTDAPREVGVGNKRVESEEKRGIAKAFQ